MQKSLLFALALIALPLAGCAEEEVIDQATPATDAPVIEEPAMTEPALDAVEGEEVMTEEALTEEAAPIEGEVAPEVPAEDGVQM